MPREIFEVESRIQEVRGHKVLLDRDLAEMYGVTVGAMNQAVKRQARRFPSDFLIQLTDEEAGSLISQSVMLKRGGHRKHPLKAFTEQGVAMLASVLQSDRAVNVNIAIMRAFVRLRGFTATQGAVARKLEELEIRVDSHDQDIRQVFEAIRQMMAIETKPKPRIGFAREEDNDKPKNRKR